MQKLSQNITDILSNGNVIKNEDRERCRYGIEIMLSSVSEMLCILFVSLFIKNFAETLIFFIAFIPLRIYAGGYHADTRWRCFAILVGVYMMFTVFMQYISKQPYVIYITYGGTLFTIAMVLLFSPILHSRKHLTPNEIKAFRKIAVRICALETTLTLLGTLIFGNNVYILAFVCGQLAVSISMVAACIKKYFKGGAVK